MEVLLGPTWASRLVLVLTVTCVYAGAILVNNELLFRAVELDRYRYLIFLPAGLKLLLVMLFGWRGVMGVALGIACSTLSEFSDLSLAQGLLFGATLALSTQLALRACSVLLRVDFPWDHLTWSSLLILVMTVGVFDAVAFQVAMSGIGHGGPGSEALIDIASNAASRIVGGFLFICCAVQLRQYLRRDSAQN